MFSIQLLATSPSSNVPYLDEGGHAAGWSSLMVYQIFSSESLCVHLWERMLQWCCCINCYILWKKININIFWIPKHTYHYLASWWLCREYLAAFKQFISRIIATLSIKPTKKFCWFHFLFVRNVTTQQFYTTNGKVWRRLALARMCRSEALGHLPGSKCSVVSNCPQKSFMFIVPLS
jgi:hypothetical protein